MIHCDTLRGVPAIAALVQPAGDGGTSCLHFAGISRIVPKANSYDELPAVVRQLLRSPAPPDSLFSASPP